MTEVPTGLTEAIAARREALARQADDEQAYRASVELVELLLQRGQLTGEDPVEAIRIADALNNALPADSPARALPLLHLAMAQWARANHHGEQAVRTALVYLRELRPLLDDELPMHVEIRARGGMFCADTAIVLGDPDCAAEAVADLDAAFALSTDEQLRRGIQFHRAKLCSARFRTMGGPNSDLRYAVDTLTAFLAQPGIPPELADHCHLELVNLIVAEQLPPDARNAVPWSEQQAVEYVRAAPAAALRAHLDALSPQAAADPSAAGIRINVIAGQGAETTQQDWDVLAGDLGVIIGATDEHAPHRHELVALRAALASDPPADDLPAGLDEGIAELRRKLVELGGGPASFAILLQLNALLLQRTELTGQDSARSIEIAGALVALQPEQAGAHLQLAIAHAARDSQEDLRRAAEILRDLRPADDAERAEFFAQCGFINAKLALSTRDPADVAETIELLDAALAGVPDGTARRRTWMFRASMYQLRFLQMGGTAEDHRLAVEAFTEALSWDDPRTQDDCHAALAALLLYRDVPAAMRGQEPETDELYRYVDHTVLPEVQQHLAAMSSASGDELAAVRLLAWSPDQHDDMAPVLRDLAMAAGDELSSAELDAIHAVTSGLQTCQDDAGIEQLLTSASEGLPADSPLHDMFLLFRMRSPENLGTSDLARLLSRQEQRIEALPEGSAERAEELIAQAAILIVQAQRGDHAALARAKEIAQHVTQRYPEVETASGISHALLALSAEYGMGHPLETIQDALDHVRRADELLAPDDEIRADMVPVLGKMLVTRFFLSGNREDADAAQYYSFEAQQRLPGLAAWLAEVESEQITDPEAGMSKLHAAVGDEMPEHYARWVTRCVISLRLLRPREFRPDSAPPDPAGLAAARRALVAAQQLPESDAERAIEVAGAAVLCAASGLVADDVELADEGLAALDAVSRQPDLPKELEYFTVQLLAYARQARSWHRTSDDALDSAIDGLERMLRERPPGNSEALAANFAVLAANYEQRGERRRAIETGLEALRARARGVLLQSSPQRAMKVASSAAGGSPVAVQRCLRAGDLESAVQALELGRGMVLHAATSAATMPDLLRSSGHPDLAERWHAEVDQQQPWDSGTDRSSPAQLQLPSDLRLAAQRALKGTAAEEELLSPPSAEEISTALRARSARALVYLTAGEAVVITDEGRLHHLPLAALRDRDPVQHFDLLQRERARIGEAVQQPWQAALQNLCDWAWTAAIGPLLDWLGGEQPRIVLVPTGKLNLVPWHAARKPLANGRFRFACQDAVIGYAASARQFVEAARRPAPRFADHPVLVRTPDLYWTRHEIGHIHAAHYGHGHYLGRPGGRSVPTPDDVLAALPGTTMLHLGCHATPAELPVDSALRLGSGRSLPVREILRHKSGPHGALVVLAACSSDLTGRQHDEVLTLATAFLAAGAGGVVGTRWEIDDLVTAMFMIVFHHHLNDGFPEPADALRAAQLWMLDPHRRPIPGVPDELARYFAETDPATPAHWAAFTYHGR
ncbi:CHAT domain-containing protein [Saccharopolyspora antimicrobica]|uniref:CHAT domain-containing protein n=1 Tax=Saccharopolyspora antimicrobica TaxID=455193 RepID=A0A1I5GLY5_9PSEU|nr:CHAT domain-containing protein [Saccharopolyspora antimicrobica]RKT87466.1 CHAT domain-containing protein [Saccharopolyspora antimicrobica]SFO37064.1 CHAT domain-containing protein [Saccharopolyspora antimicrobica]